MERLVTIELLGQTYTFKAEADTSTAQAVADLLAKEVARIEAQMSAKSAMSAKQTVLVLAALNIAGENHRLKERHAALARNIGERAANLIRKLDSMSGVPD